MQGSRPPAPHRGQPPAGEALNAHSTMVQGCMYATAMPTIYPSTAHLTSMPHADLAGASSAATGPISRRPIFGKCPFCQLSIYTVTRERSGPMTYCAAASLGIAGALPGLGLTVAISGAWALLIPVGIAACAALPFMRCARLQNIDHHCPHCDHVVAIYNRF